jgi:hypothetical protein
MAGFNDFSTTAASNSSIGGQVWAEGQLPSTVNNSARQLLADLADVRDGNVVATGWHVKANGLVIRDQADTTKKVIFDASSVSAGSTRTIGFQNAAGTVALLGNLGINSDTEETSPATGDAVPFYSASAGAERKITLANLLKVIDSLTAETAGVSGDELAIYSSSAGAVRKITLANALKVINSLTAETSAASGDKILLYSASAGAVRAITKANFASPGTLTAGTAAVQNPYAANTITTQAHGLGAAPAILSAYLECLTGELGYSAGDRVFAGFTDNNAGDAGCSATADATSVVLATASVKPFVNNKTTGTLTAITAANWKFVAQPYKIN